MTKKHPVHRWLIKLRAEVGILMAISAFTTRIESSSELARYISGVAIGGMAISAIPTRKTIEKDADSSCAPGPYELRMAITFAGIAVSLTMVCCSMLVWMKIWATSLYGDNIDEEMKKRTRQAFVLKSSLFIAHIVLCAAFLAAVMTVILTLQVKTTKFECLRMGTLLAFTLLGVVAVMLMCTATVETWMSSCVTGAAAAGAGAAAAAGAGAGAGGGGGGGAAAAAAAAGAGGGGGGAAAAAGGGGGDNQDPDNISPV